jgi:hypothetical protein
MNTLAVQPGKGLRSSWRQPKPANQVGIDSRSITSQIVIEDHLDLRLGEMVPEPPDLGCIVGHVEKTLDPPVAWKRISLTPAATLFLRSELPLEIGAAGNAHVEVLSVERLHHGDRLPEHHDDPGGRIKCRNPGGRFLGGQVKRGRLPEPAPASTLSEVIQIHGFGGRLRTGLDVGTEKRELLQMGHEEVRMLRQVDMQRRCPALWSANNEQIGAGRLF